MCMVVQTMVNNDFNHIRIRMIYKKRGRKGIRRDVRRGKDIIIHKGNKYRNKINGNAVNWLIYL